MTTARMELFQGDCREVLRELAVSGRRVQTCVTSPPYFSLRDYGVDGQIGLESSPAAYVSAMVEVFRCVRDVLRDDGTVWLNLGDSYNASPPGNKSPMSKSGLNGAQTSASYRARLEETQQRQQEGRRLVEGLKPKDLIGIPWRVAFALQEDGWYLRSDVIWSKPNPMPESVRDRPTRSHEYLFLLSKGPRYYYDGEAVREAGPSYKRNPGHRSNGAAEHVQGRHTNFSTRVVQTTGRNRRSVWTVTTKAYKGAHFATFPPKLIVPCIKAGTSEKGCCPACGACWRRVVERKRTATRPGNDSKVYEPRDVKQDQVGKSTYVGFNERWREAKEVGNRDPQRHVTETATVGWEPACACGAPESLRPDDLEVIESPTGERVGGDPTMQTGRAGYNRPRGDNEGVRPMTRYEQRRYAEHLRASHHRPSMESEAGAEAFAHYLRTDRSGARPIPPDLLGLWLSRGWLAAVDVPTWEPPAPVPCTVLDPFNGAGTSALVSLQLGCNYVGVDLNAEYLALTRKRIAKAGVLETMF